MQTEPEIDRATYPNAAQLHAIHTTDCPLLIIAGPGSGKTFTLVGRAYYLIAEKNVPPEHILISTFTEKAAREIITRLSNKLIQNDRHVNLNEMYIGTLHSIFLKILEENRYATQKAPNPNLNNPEPKKILYTELEMTRN